MIKFNKKRQLKRKTKQEKLKIVDTYAVSIFRSLERYQISDATSKAINLKIDKMAEMII